MKPLSVLILLCLVLAGNSNFGQGIRVFNNNVSKVLEAQGSSHSLLKFSLIFGIKERFTIIPDLGLSFGFWQENPSLQYSLNTALQWRFGKAFLGNYRNGSNSKDSRSRSQLVFMFTPMLTVNLGGKDYIYQELEPFYLGTPNAVYSKYRYALTLGSSFTVSPRGTFKNITTARNRSQQVAMLSLNLKDFNFTIYDDFLSIATTALQLGDNWDRFFTGGGFIRYRFNDEFTLHLYSEVYTGINRANAFLTPDIISYKPGGEQWELKNYANQDPGQEYFNTAWLILKGTYTSSQVPGNSSGVYLPSFNFMVGTAAPWTMFSQRFIHSLFHYDDANKLRLHYFLPRSNVPGNLEAGGNINWNSLFTGAGFQSNISMP